MNISKNSQKIQNLFNNLQKAITDFQPLIFPNEFIAFQFYKIHLETLLLNIENNVTGKLSLALFRKLFENDNEFKECTHVKEEYINLLIDILNARDEEEKEEAKNEIDSKIVVIFFNLKINNNKKQMVKKFVKRLEDIGIKTELYYLLLILIIENDFNLEILIDYLPEILKERFVDSTFDFSDVFKIHLNFDEFIIIFLSAFAKDKNYNYVISQFNKETKKIIITEKSIDEISDIIINTSNNKTKDKQHKNKKSKEKASKEKNELNIQNSNEKNEINISEKTNIQEKDEGTGDKEKSFEIENIYMENMRKLIDENNKKVNEQMKVQNNKIENLEKENKQMKQEIKELKNSNKTLKENIKNVHCKIMENKKKISLLEFDIKIIGLRDAYKSFIDLIIFIMDLEVYGNIETKIQSIKDAIKKANKKNADKMFKLLEDCDNLISYTNDKAHYIDLNQDMIKQLIYNLSKFSGNKEYLDLINIIQDLNIKTDFEKLVKNRMEKYKKSKEDFIQNQISIKESIQKNPRIKNGNGFSVLMNS